MIKGEGLEENNLGKFLLEPLPEYLNNHQRGLPSRCQAAFEDELSRGLIYSFSLYSELVFT